MTKRPSIAKPGAPAIAPVEPGSTALGTTVPTGQGETGFDVSPTDGSGETEPSELSGTVPGGQVEPDTFLPTEATLVLGATPERAAGAAEASALAGLQPDVPAAGDGLGYLVIVSSVPGFKRGNVVHEKYAEYPLDYFSQAQLDAFRAEPKLTLIEVGGKAVASPVNLSGPGKPFEDADGNVIASDADFDLAGRAQEAAVATVTKAADSDIKHRALRDTARQHFRSRR